MGDGAGAGATWVANPALPEEEEFAIAAAALLFANGQTTEALQVTVARLSHAAGVRFQLLAGWDHLTLLSERFAPRITVPVVPTGIDIGRVAAAETIVDRVVAGETSMARGLHALAEIADLPPIGLGRFTLMAGAGAAALAVIFGAGDLLTVVVVAMIAMAGACLRRGVSHLSDNVFIQPLLAAGLTGIVAGATTRFGLPVSFRLVAVCPCMLLVPGPHLLNGAMDLARARVLLGAARLTFGGLVVLAICAGLLLGLASSSTSLASGGPQPHVPFAADVAAAGVAVSAYGSFFNMRWRMVVAPVLAGMSAHALRWELLAHGASVPMGAFAGCLLVGTVMSLLGHPLRVPFAALAFAAVVSLIPGVFLFEAASQAIALSNPGSGDPAKALTGLASNGTTAALVLLGMTAGLVLPRLCSDALPSRLTPRERARKPGGR